MQDYTHFSAEDFAAHPDFIAWVQKPASENHHFWTSWMASHPEQEETIRQARKMVESIRFAQYPVSAQAYHRVWQQIQKNKEKHTEQSTPTKVVSLKYWYGLAASLLLALSLSLVAYHYLPIKETAYATAYQEKEEIRLPDGSRVYLNANSSLRLSSDWKESRDVWLQGEAFFEIKKIQTDNHTRKPFIVHTAGLNVEVLGTQFNVNHRRQKTQVVLSSGKVKLHVPDLLQEVTMVPGELAELSAQKLTKKIVEPQDYSAWRNNKLIFDHVTLKEIAALLEESYGYEVEIVPAALGQERFQGSTPADNLEVLFVSLEATLDISIRQEGNKIMIENKQASSGEQP